MYAVLFEQQQPASVSIDTGKFPGGANRQYVAVLRGAFKDVPVVRIAQGTGIQFVLFGGASPQPVVPFAYKIHIRHLPGQANVYIGKSISLAFACVQDILQLLIAFPKRLVHLRFHILGQTAVFLRLNIENFHPFILTNHGHPRGSARIVHFYQIKVAYLHHFSRLERLVMVSLLLIRVPGILCEIRQSETQVVRYLLDNIGDTPLTFQLPVGIAAGIKYGLIPPDGHIGPHPHQLTAVRRIAVPDPVIVEAVIRNPAQLVVGIQRLRIPHIAHVHIRFPRGQQGEFVGGHVDHIEKLVFLDPRGMVIPTKGGNAGPLCSDILQHRQSHNHPSYTSIRWFCSGAWTRL